MTRTKEPQITEGPIFSALIRFAIPIMLTQLIQILFSAVDISVLGHMAGTDAVASVGTTASITGIMIGLFSGFGTGLNIILARFVGARDSVRTKRAVSTSILLAGVFGIVLMVVGFFFSPLILRWIDCPPECMEGATLYLRIYLLSAPSILIYNFGSAVIRVAGDAKSPMYYIIAAGGLKVVLNCSLCLLMSNKVAAVAISMLISQMFSAFLVVFHLVRIKGDCRLDLRHLCFDLKILKLIILYGFYSSLTNTSYYIPNLIIQSSINSFGAAAITGNTAATNLEAMFRCVFYGFTVAAAVFVGQNLGAERYDRVRTIIRYGFLFCGISSIALSTVAYVFAEPLLRLYIGGSGPAVEAALYYGKARVIYVQLLSVLDALNYFMAQVLTTAGYPFVHTIGILVSDIAARVFWMLVLLPKHHTIEFLYLCYPVSRFLFTIVLVVAFVIFWRKLRAGRLHKI